MSSRRGNLGSLGDLGAADLLAISVAEGHLAEPVEEVSDVVGPRRRLRVVLHREERQLTVREALDGVVVQVDVGDLDGLASTPQAVRFDRVTVVLGADGHLAREEILAGLVASVMTELELARGAPQREPQNLVAQAMRLRAFKMAASSTLIALSFL